MEVKRFVFPPVDVTVFLNDTIRVFVPRMPHTHAQYGGHLVIQTKEFRSLCYEFTNAESRQAWAMVQACTDLMIERLGAERTNNQDNGNWFFLKPLDEQAKGKPRCHIHVYGRSSKEDEYQGPGSQKWGKSLDFPLPDEPGLEEGAVWMHYIHPYTDQQIELIKAELPKYFEKYRF